MPSYNTLAIVLRRLTYGETDNILTLFSRDLGKISAIAKGARKAISRLSGATEVLTCTRFQLATGKSLEIVTQVEVEEAFSPLRQDLARLAHGLYLADLLDHSVEDGSPNPDLFDLLLEGLRLTQTLPSPELAARWFETQLLLDLGYAPNLAECAVCHAPVPGGWGRDETFALSASQAARSAPATPAPPPRKTTARFRWAHCGCCKPCKPSPSPTRRRRCRPCPPPAPRVSTWRG